MGNLLNTTATFPGLAVLFALQALVGAGIAVNVWRLLEVSNGVGILDFEIGYSLDRVNQILSAYQDEGFELYRNVQLLDVLNPAIYGMIAASLLWLLVRESRNEWLIVVPMFAACLDYAENLAIWAMVNSYPNIPGWIANASSGLSVVKMLSMLAMILAFLWAYLSRTGNSNAS